ncbi:MAG TPA: 30S ribosomal protein S3 [Candidatus Bathyarchaeia archaeon]|nr:30S ribosomal protein S3 [Candidatus Bathyarchaeia archaeon]
MSVIRHFINESKKKLVIDEFLTKELERTGYCGVDISKTPLGTRVTIYSMKPGLVIGRRGQNIKELTQLFEERFKLSNPQIAVAEVEVPELNPNIMASRVAAALQKGIHFRRVGFWVLNRIMEAKPLGAEIIIRGKLRSERARYEKFRAGYIPKTGDFAQRNMRTAVVHVRLKPGTLGIKVNIMPRTEVASQTVEVKPEEIQPSPSSTIASPQEVVPEGAPQEVVTPQEGNLANP